MDAALTFRLEKVVHAPREVMEDFEGPLDLILFLLSKNKIEIQDLRISLLCHQFVLWIEARKGMDLEVASDFILMASHLVYLKTKMLLTVGDGPDEEIDLLKQALEERLRQEGREKMLIARDFLAERAEIGRQLLCKGSEPLETDKTYAWTHDVSELTRAFADMFGRAERRSPPPPALFSGIVGREPYPVSEKIASILKTLAQKGKTVLTKIFRGCGRSELVAAFLAILELCRSREVLIEEIENENWILLGEKNGKS